MTTNEDSKVVETFFCDICQERFETDGWLAGEKENKDGGVQYAFIQAFCPKCGNTSKTIYRFEQMLADLIQVKKEVEKLKKK